MLPREITEDDYPAIQNLHRSVGWPQRSMAGWRWLHANPARLEIGAAAGWVVDGPDGAPAAHIGNLIQRFRLGDRRLYGASGFSIIVSPKVRGASRPLLNAFAGQSGVFARYTFNANNKSQPLYVRHGMNAWPDQTHALKLSWIANPVPLALGRLLRRLYDMAPRIVGGLGEQLMNDRLGRAVRLALPPGVGLLTDFGDGSPYGRFWETLAGEDRLLADRSPEVQRWRLEDPDLSIPPLALAFERDGAVVGYAMALMAKSNILEPPVLEIIDLETLKDHVDAVPALMGALRQAAHAMGAAKLRTQTVTPLMLQRLGGLAGAARREGGWGHCHARFSEDAPDPALWSPTPYDADYAVCLRPVPLDYAARREHAVRTARSVTSKA